MKLIGSNTSTYDKMAIMFSLSYTYTFSNTIKLKVCKVLVVVTFLGNES